MYKKDVHYITTSVDNGPREDKRKQDRLQQKVIYEFHIGLIKVPIALRRKWAGYIMANMHGTSVAKRKDKHCSAVRTQSSSAFSIDFFQGNTLWQ